VAAWREALLAQKALRGGTRGYSNHPQLERFKTQPDPLRAIGCFLTGLYHEAVARGYRFDKMKINSFDPAITIKAARGQLLFEWGHLKRKLRVRDVRKYRDLLKIVDPESHPLFTITNGGVEDWEKGNGHD
jgi:hypothetical protein